MFQWHPFRPTVASVSSYGAVLIWGINYQENWSAFAPDFRELEENVEYSEREDEFDIVRSRRACPLGLAEDTALIYCS